MENAKVGIFEDRENLRFFFGILLDADGHKVVAEAGSVKEAATVIDELKPGDIDVALVDGNLGESDDLSEGATITRMLREKFGDTVAILGISASGEPIKGVDKNIDKFESGKIREYIDQL